MINSTKVFTFNGTASTSFTPSIINATLDNDMYEFAPLGAKSIKEQKIQGRDLPYFYNVDYEPISFKMTIAFEDYATMDEVREVIHWLYLPKQPAPLQFTEYGLNFFGIFVGQPNFYYVGNNLSGYKFIGYIDVEFRANAPYGWTNLLSATVVSDGDHNFTNPGSFEILPSFSLTNTHAGASIVTLECNDKTFEYEMVEDEVLVFNGYTKTLEATVNGVAVGNPYAKWNKDLATKDYIVFNSIEVNNGVNTVNKTCVPADSVTLYYSFRAPKIL